MKITKNLVVYCLTYLLAFTAQGLSYGLLITYLIGLGFPALTRSILLSVSAGMGILGQFMIGYLCDKTHTIKRYVYIFYVLLIMVTFVLYWNPNSSFLLISIAFVVYQIVTKVLLNIVDSWILENDKEGKETYGISRAFGSIGWAFGCFILPYITNSIGYHYIGAANAVVVIMLMLVGTQMKDAQKSKEDKTSFEDIKKLLSSKRYIYLLLTFFGVFMMQMCVDFMVIEKFNILHATESQISSFWSIVGMVELPVFFLGNKIVKKFSEEKCTIFVAISYALRYICYGLTNSVTMLIVISAVTQAAAYPLLQIVSKNLFDDESPSNLRSSGLQIGLALSGSTCALIGPMILGLFIDVVGINGVLYITSCFSLLALFFISLYIKDKKSNKVATR